MADDDVMSAVRVAGTLVIGLVVLLVFFLWRAGGVYEWEAKSPEVQKAESKGATSLPVKTKPKPQPSPQPKRGHKPKAPAHPWLVNTLKGHTGRITTVEFSQDGKVLASASDDRTIRLWPVKHLGDTGGVKHVQCNVDLDHATHLSFSPDGKACAASMAQDHRLRLYDVDPKGTGPGGALSLKQQLPADSGMAYELVGCGVSVVNPITRTGCTYLMAATAATELSYFSVDGTILQDVDTKMIGQNFACVSPNGRLTVVCGRLGMVRVLEVKGKGGVFVRAETVADLMGHKGQAEHAAFSLCSRRLAAVASGGSWQVWDVDVEFDKRADARRLGGGDFEHVGDGTRAVCALSPDLHVVAVGCGSRITLHRVETSELLATIPDAHSEGSVTGLGFDAEGRYLCSGGGMDKRLRVWRNVPSAKIRLEELRTVLKRGEGGAAGMERVQASINELKKDLASFEQKG